MLQPFVVRTSSVEALLNLSIFIMAEVKTSRSPVWSYFDVVAPQGKATCRLCGKQLTYKAVGGTTSNLLKHLTTAHATVWRQRTTDSSQHSQQSSGSGPLDTFVKKMVCPAGRAGQLTEAIVGMVALDLRPAGIVEGVGFRRLMQVAEPGYRVPSRTFISSLLRKKHADGLDKLRQLLHSTTGEESRYIYVL